jgi:hypothetical protein
MIFHHILLCILLTTPLTKFLGTCGETHDETKERFFKKMKNYDCKY